MGERHFIALIWKPSCGLCCSRTPISNFNLTCEKLRIRPNFHPPTQHCTHKICDFVTKLFFLHSLFVASFATVKISLYELISQLFYDYCLGVIFRLTLFYFDYFLYFILITFDSKVETRNFSSPFFFFVENHNLFGITSPKTHFNHFRMSCWPLFLVVFLNFDFSSWQKLKFSFVFDSTWKMLHNIHFLPLNYRFPLFHEFQSRTELSSFTYVVCIPWKGFFFYVESCPFFFNFLQLSVHKSPIVLFLNFNELEIFVFERFFVFLPDLLALDEFRIKTREPSRNFRIFSIFSEILTLTFEWYEFYSIQSQVENSSSAPVCKKRSSSFE